MTRTLGKILWRHDRIIAAAPDLLEALQQIEKMSGHGVIGSIARAAIAKAEQS